jgi:hypothetical protein
VTSTVRSGVAICTWKAFAVTTAAWPGVSVLDGGRVAQHDCRVTAKGLVGVLGGEGGEAVVNDSDVL